MTDKINIGVGVSSERDAVKAVKEAIQQAKSTIFGEKIDLAIVFSSVEFSRPLTIKTIANILGPIPIVGCSAAAIISSKGIFKNGLAIALFGLPKAAWLNTAIVENTSAKDSLVAGEELGDKLLHGYQGLHRDLGLIFSDGLIEESSNIIYGLQEKLGTSFPLVGASASDNLKFFKTYIYFNQTIASDAICGIIWGGRLNFSWGVKHGWKPLGKPRQVTKAKSNIVYEIDGQPAAKLYEDYLARNLADLKKELRRISIFYPIGIHLQGENEYLLRNVLAICDDGALIFQGNIPENSQIRLMIGTKESCLDAARQAVREAQKGLGDKKLGLALVFDSLSRFILLGRDAIKEVEAIQEELGKETPIIGIYTYGEQAPLGAIGYHGRAYLHNQTITVLGIEG